MSKRDCHGPVAVFDSGVGGISVLKELYSHLPNENYWYFGDSANSPYGTKSAEAVQELTSAHIGRMIDGGAKAVVLACNTATSAAAAMLREKYRDVPIIGIEPEVKTAALDEKNDRVLIMATPVTLQLEKFRRLMNLYSDKAEITVLPCPGLAELVEKGRGGEAEVRRYLKNILAAFREEPVDAVVLGCTHYPHIRPLIKEALGAEVRFYDGSAGTARELKRRLIEQDLLSPSDAPGEIRFENSHNTKRMIELSKELFYAK